MQNIEKLADNAKTRDIVEKLNEVIDALQSRRDRGPNSTREMTEDDAYRVLLGDLKMPKSTKEAAEELGLSYGQVYSARKGFTFKTIYAKWRAQGNDRRSNH